MGEERRIVNLPVDRNEKTLWWLLEDIVNKINYLINGLWNIQTANSITVNAGTPTGTVTDVQTLLDGNTLDIAEVAATPGFDVEFEFTSVVNDPKKIIFRLKYVGSATHGIGIDVYNNDTTTWDRMGYFSNQLEYDWITVDLIQPTNYIDSSMVMTVRLYHFSAGNASHDIYIDYAAIQMI